MARRLPHLSGGRTAPTNPPQEVPAVSPQITNPNSMTSTNQPKPNFTNYNNSNPNTRSNQSPTTTNNNNNNFVNNTTNDTKTTRPATSTPPQNTLNNNQKNSQIDTDNIPRPMLYTQDSSNLRTFTSNQSISLPPQVHQHFSNVDEGNSNPRLIRPTLTNLPIDPNQINQSQIPLGAIIQPLADTTPEEEAVGLSDAPTIFRCSRCKAYVNPYFKFFEGGYGAICNICKMQNQVMGDYVSGLNEFGERMDKHSKSELCKGAYEFVAPQDYKQREVDFIHVIFCIELSTFTINNGIYTQAIYSLQSVLDYIPYSDKTKIAVCTFNNTLNFYNIPHDLNNDPQLVVVPDLDDPCCPIPREKMFLNVLNDREKIDYILEKLLKNAETYVPDVQNPFAASVGSVVNSVATIMAPCVGRIVAFTSQLPQIGLGRLKKRDDYQLIGNELEKTLYLPQCNIFEEISKFCQENQIIVDLFAFENDYLDLATIVPMVNRTGGSLYFYPSFDPYRDREKVHYEIFRNMTRSYAYDVILTVRTSPGLVLQEYITSAGKLQVRDLELAGIDADKSFAVLFKQQEQINDPFAYIQFAMLYTNLLGQRVIRVINYAFAIVNNIQNLFRSADMDAVGNLLIRKTTLFIPIQPIKVIRDVFLNSVINVLHAYRTLCASSSPSGQLILPQSLKLLPLYCQSMLKRELFRFATNIKPDQRVAEIHRFLCYNMTHLHGLIYPQIYPISQLWQNELTNSPGNIAPNQRTILPSTVPGLSDKLAADGLYLVDNCEYIYIYVTKDANAQILYDLFGLESLPEISGLTDLPSFETSLNQQVTNIIDQLRKNKNGTYQCVQIVVQKDINDKYVLECLVEDPIKANESYGDFLCTVHKLIQQKTN